MINIEGLQNTRIFNTRIHNILSVRGDTKYPRGIQFFLRYFVWGYSISGGYQISCDTWLNVIVYFLLFLGGGASFSFCIALSTVLLASWVTCSDGPVSFVVKSAFAGLKHLRILVFERTNSKT